MAGRVITNLADYGKATSFFIQEIFAHIQFNYISCSLFSLSLSLSSEDNRKAIASAGGVKILIDLAKASEEESVKEESISALASITENSTVHLFVHLLLHP